MNNIVLASINNAVLASMDKIELASMNNVVLASMDKIELPSMDKRLSTILFSHDNNVVTTLFSYHCCNKLVTS